MSSLSLFSTQHHRAQALFVQNLANGAKFPLHLSHRSGLEMDIRPLRKDGQQRPVSYREAQYDQEGTRKLIELFWSDASVKQIFFNDSDIPRIRRLAGHDDHFHVAVMP